MSSQGIGAVLRSSGNRVYVLVSLERVRSSFSQTSSVPAEPFVGTSLHLFVFFVCLSAVTDTQVDLE